MRNGTLRRTLRRTILVAFLGIAAVAAWAIVKASGPGSSESGKAVATSGRSVNVQTSTVTARTFEERLHVQGNLKAEYHATVAARVGGTVERILVNEGDLVVAGETELFRTDSVTLDRELQISREQLEVARCALGEAQANRERLHAILDKSLVDYERSERLYKQSVGSLSRVEQLESEYKQAVASVKHADSQVNLASEKVEQAELFTQIAEKQLRDSHAVAPVSGRISKKFVEEGEMASVGQAVLRIENTSDIEVSAFLPAQYYPRIVPGETQINLDVYGVLIEDQKVSYKSPTIDPALRTFEMKCVLEDPPDCVVPGAMAEVSVILDRQQGLAVPIDAVQERDGRPVVFIADGGRARMLHVETGLETDGFIACQGDGLVEGASIVTLGQYLLNDGDGIAMRQEAN